MAEDSERDEDAGATNNKTYEDQPLSCFKDLYQCTPIYKAMSEYGSFIVPLSMVGMFMNFCGNYILHYIHSVLKKKIFYPCHKVISIQLLGNGEVNTLAIRK